MRLTQPQPGTSVHPGDWTFTQALAGRGDLMAQTIMKSLGWGCLLQDKQLHPSRLHQEHCQPKEKQTLWLSDQAAVWGEKLIE